LGDSVKPLEVQKIWEQTGKLYYRGRDAEGNRIPVPITELANTGFAPQLQALIQLYQFHYQVLKDELGEDPNLMNQAAQPRVAASNIEASRALANNATEYMYDAYIYVMEETSKKISCLINKSVTYGAKKYSNLLKQEFVKDRNFVASIKMLPNTTELMNLQAMMNNAVSSNPQLILYLDPFKAMRMAKENVALGELYFRQAQKRYIKTEQEKAQINSEQNAQSQQLSIKAKMEADTALTQQQALTKEKEIILQGVFDLAKANIPVPQELQGLVSDMLQNVTVPIVAQNKQQMAAMQAQQEMSQQQMQQGGEEQQLQEEQQMEMQQQ
jgi:hypothetical protein